ncbi:unnamed protein product [Ambrosiozyma monospora]|uniref:Unnamed protein product n=1 Tax=Ambrosiozyma monospora TaxID=43982 RepID=A0A9W6YRK5_AMBMO|nr:unnamed protein product [Ambrosiozyma monospora]
MSSQASVSTSAYYKKKAGMLSIYEDEVPPKLVWRCVDTSVANAFVEFPLQNISRLQATKRESTDKIMLKLALTSGPTNDGNNSNGEQKPASEVKHSDVLFRFNNFDSMDSVKVILQQVIARKKAEISARNTAAVAKDGTPVPANGDGTGSKEASATPAAEQPVESNVENDEFLAELLDSKKLLKNLTLQQKLLRDNPNLMKTFTDAVIKSGLEPAEFWSTRLHLLRSYALQTNQKRGPYNVLSTIKPVASSDNQVNVAVTREKIHEIFKQYPLVRKAYDDTVPKISEGEFWSRFFSSKLFRKLRGEKVNLHDRGDTKLDKYLYYDPDYDGEEEDEDVDKLLEDKDKGRSKKKDDGAGTVAAVTAQLLEKSSGKKGSKRKKRHHKEEEEPIQLTASKKKVRLFHDISKDVPKFIDVGANDEDNAQRLGNKPDITMKPDQDPDLVNILRSMNRLSRRMMSTIKDDETVDLEKEFSEELEIKDLEDIEDVEYNELKYTQRSNLSSGIIPTELITQAKAYTPSPLNPNPQQQQQTNGNGTNLYDSFIPQFTHELTIKLDLSKLYQEKKPNQEAYKEINQLLKKTANQSSQSWTASNTAAKLSSAKAPPSAVDPSSPTTTAIPAANSDTIEEPETPLKADKLEPLRITHSTSIEFLKHFWLHYNSISSSSINNNPKFKSELISLKKLYFSVSKCKQRIQSHLEVLDPVEDKAERDAAQEMCVPLLKSIDAALKSYEDAIVG